MRLEYYPIRGRGPDGTKFQLARIKDEAGNYHKGSYDQARQFASEDELKGYLAGVLSVDESTLELSKMSL